MWGSSVGGLKQQFEDQALWWQEAWLGHEPTASVGVYGALQGFSHPFGALCSVQEPCKLDELRQEGCSCPCSCCAELCAGNGGNFS